MAIAREIVEFLRTASTDAFRSSVELRLDNWNEVINRPSVLNAEGLRFTPGSVNAAIARIALTVKGCTFVRNLGDLLWRPKNDDDLVGIRSFVSSAYFQNFSDSIKELKDIQECRDVTLRIISELLNCRVSVERIMSRPYRDWVNVWFDYNDLLKILSEFDCAGFSYENNRWISKRDGENLVSSHICAMALLESLNGEEACSHFYANFQVELYNVLKVIANDDGNNEMSRLLSSLYVGHSFRKNFSEDSRHVFLLLSEISYSTILCYLSTSQRELAKNALLKFDHDFMTAKRHWDKICKNELFVKRIKLGTVLQR